MAGDLAVRLHDTMLAQGWLDASAQGYSLTGKGEESLRALGLGPQGPGLAHPARDTERRGADGQVFWPRRVAQQPGTLRFAGSFFMIHQSLNH